MDNTILLYNNSFSFNLKQIMENVNDLLYNIQSLKQLQMNIDKIQSLKDKGQMQVNMASLTFLRCFIFDDPDVGKVLFYNLIRKYYPLKDEQIIKYETDLLPNSVLQITNESVLNRKGLEFELDSRKCKGFRRDVDFYKNEYNHDFHADSKINDANAAYAGFRRAIMENQFMKWDWDILKEIKKGSGSTYQKDKSGEKIDSIYRILSNNGFLAQLGLTNIENFIENFEEIAGMPLSQITKDRIIQRYKELGFRLHSYLPLAKDFIILHQDELDWRVLQRNPRISWDLELINLLLKKIRNTVNESEWNEALQGSRAMYAAIDNLLNDEILSDIEKLYDV